MSTSKDHRIWVRYTRSPDMPGVAETQAGNEQVSWTAQIQDISRGGVSLLSNQSFDVGTVLKIDLPNSDQVVPATVLARVVHAAGKPNGVWTLGCAFVKELREDELQALLQAP